MEYAYSNLGWCSSPVRDASLKNSNNGSWLHLVLQRLAITDTVQNVDYDGDNDNEERGISRMRQLFAALGEGGVASNHRVLESLHHCCTVRIQERARGIYARHCHIILPTCSRSGQRQYEHRLRVATRWSVLNNLRPTFNFPPPLRLPRILLQPAISVTLWMRRRIRC